VTLLERVIPETLRFRPALLTGGYRETPPEGIDVDSVFLSGGVNLFVPMQQIQADSRYWDRAAEFPPGRWAES